MAFRPRSRIIVLDASAVAATAPADTNENILATITIPAGAMGLNGFLRYRFRFSQTNNANAKTARLRLGGIGGTDMWTGQSIASQALFQFDGQVANVASASVQKGTVMLGASSMSNSAAVAGAINTSAATTLVATIQKGTAGDTVTLESYLVELILP